jgi:probable F420-dependent oxidoreductase
MPSSPPRRVSAEPADSTRAIRVGVGPAGIPAIRSAADTDRFVEFAMRAEQLGYSSICVGDHLDDRGAPLVLLTAAAMRTQQITLATHVLNNELRNVAVVAQEARTVQAISGGRLELGLGAGWLERDFHTAGIEMAPFARRLRRLEEMVEALRGRLGGSDLPVPRIVLGGGGPAMLAAAARHADIVTINIPLRSGSRLAANTVAQGTRAAFGARVAAVRDAAVAAGRAVDIHVYVHDVHTGPDWEPQAAAAAARVGLAFDEYLTSPHVLAGDIAELAGTVCARRADLGIGYFSIPGSALEAFAPVLERLSPR